MKRIVSKLLNWFRKKHYESITNLNKTRTKINSYYVQKHRLENPTD